MNDPYNIDVHARCEGGWTQMFALTAKKIPVVLFNWIYKLFFNLQNSSLEVFGKLNPYRAEHVCKSAKHTSTPKNYDWSVAKHLNKS